MNLTRATTFPLVFFAITIVSFGQDSSPTPKPQSPKSSNLSKDEKKASEREHKAQRQRLEAEQKEQKRQADVSRKTSEAAEKRRYQQPARIQISSDSEKVRGLIILAMSSWNYSLEDDSKYRLVFTREIKGMKGALAQVMVGNSYSGPAKHTMAWTVSEVEGLTSILVDLSVTAQMAQGKVNRIDMNKDKEWRRAVELMLGQLKRRAELPSQK